MYTRTRHFNPDASLYYLNRMRNLAQTIRDTRLAHPEARSEGTELNTFFNLDRDHVRGLEMVRAFEVTLTW